MIVWKIWQMTSVFSFFFAKSIIFFEIYSSSSCRAIQDLMIITDLISLLCGSSLCLSFCPFVIWQCHLDMVMVDIGENDKRSIRGQCMDLLCQRSLSWSLLLGSFPLFIIVLNGPLLGDPSFYTVWFFTSATNEHLISRLSDELASSSWSHIKGLLVRFLFVTWVSKPKQMQHSKTDWTNILNFC